MADIGKEVGRRIRIYRTKRRMSQEDLAHEAELHRAYIGQIERGEKIIGVGNLRKIAKALKVKSSLLLDF